jgi:[ribosomal protein S18]-alanine N-acetyltransferase
MWKAHRSTVPQAGSTVSERFAVRPPQLGDTRDLAKADIECFPDPWPAQFFVSEILADGRLNRLLVDPAGRIAAYLFCAWQYLDLHVLKVATLAQFRRSGLALRLMRIAEKHAEEMSGESLTLEVRRDNCSAIAMYEGLGYTREGIRRHYYPNGEDALVMTRRVGE